MRRKNYIILITACLLLMANAANAQFRVGFSLDRQHYLPFEPINIELQITNVSGNTLTFSDIQKNAGRITIQLRNAQNRPIHIPTNVNLAEGLTIGPGATQALQFSLNQIISLQAEGEYRINFLIEHPNIQGRMASSEKTFFIFNGEVVLMEKVGVPRENPDEVIATRNVSIIAISTPGSANQLAVRIDDGKNVYRVSRLGPEISRAKPQVLIDAMSNIHIMIMVQSTIYHYVMMDVNGRILSRTYYKPNSEFAPTLVYDQVLGTVSVKAADIAEPGRDYTLDGN